VRGSIRSRPSRQLLPEHVEEAVFMNTKRIGKWLLYSVTFLVIIGVCLVLVLWFAMRASLPQFEGTASLAGLKQPVQVERDNLGVPTVKGVNRQDIARATGFLHGQERFFQMDLMRRTAAGELSELLGPALLAHDRSLRIHRLRAIAGRAARSLQPTEAELLKAYVEGVNSGLRALGARPPEYLLLRSEPMPWLPEDSVLAALSMFVFLQDENGTHDAAMDLLATVLPPAAFDFFVPIGTDWDAPLDGTILPPAPIPSPEQFSFSRLVSKADAGRARASIGEEVVLGSNSWAVDGRISGSGSALVANDMHLALRLPNTWYRMRLICQPPGQPTPTLDITGVTLPGTPAIIVGSNRFIAWAFTNSMLDTTDLIRLEVRKAEPDLYMTADGWKPVEEHRETLKVNGGENEVVTVRSTAWGPVVTAQKERVSYAVRWVTHLDGAVNFRLLELEQIRDADAALQLAPECGIPAQNFVVGDRSGKIGWTIMGRLPYRQQGLGLTPLSWVQGPGAWDGCLPPDRYPRYQDPDDGIIWTANNRIAGGPDYMQTGPWGTDLGARARQIRDGLRDLKNARPKDMLAIQLDDRAQFLARWQQLFLSVLNSPPSASRPEAEELRSLLRKWGGRASTDSAGYRLVRGFRREVVELALEPITKRCQELDQNFYYPTPQAEQPVWTLLQERPSHLLNPRFRSYDDLLAAAVDLLVRDLQEQGLRPREATWGRRNELIVHHPIGLGLPALGRWLDTPLEQLPGDSHMPRFQSSEHGASERIAVSPGHEEEGLFHMPGGQSGHFLSPYYTAGHEAWAKGKPAPFLPGPPVHNLRLTP